MYQFTSLKGKLLAEQVEEQLLRYIVEEPIPVGERLPNEFELAERFGVGRSTIREAVKGLASKNVVEVRRGSGTYVVNTAPAEEDPLGLGQIRDKHMLALDLCDVRLLLEPDIAALAAERAEEGEIRQLAALCDETEALIRAGENHLERDMEFHTCIARCTKNVVMENLIPIITSAVNTFGTLTHRSLREETISTHRAVVEAIERGDAMGARLAMTMHLTYNRQEIIRRMEERKAEEP